jgi:hypothetical protein
MPKANDETIRVVSRRRVMTVDGSPYDIGRYQGGYKTGKRKIFDVSGGCQGKRFSAVGLRACITTNKTTKSTILNIELPVME